MREDGQSEPAPGLADSDLESAPDGMAEAGNEAVPGGRRQLRRVLDRLAVKVRGELVLKQG